MSRAPRPSRNPDALPDYWSRQSAPDGEHLSYAVRSGKTRAGLLAFAAILIAGGLWGAAWMLMGGGLTVAGLIFVLVVPGGAVLFGVYCLDRLLWARSEYVLGERSFVAIHHSIFGDKRTEIPRGEIAAISQQYTPPSSDEHQGHPGHWVTFVCWRGKGGKARDFALDGLHTPDEKQWIGPLLAEWACVELTRSFSASAEEADPDELPDD